MPAKLKPCPFCGNKKIRIIVDGGVRWARCTSCNTISNTFITEDALVEAWNKRAKIKE